jgi:hypothetical protein
MVHRAMDGGFTQTFWESEAPTTAAHCRVSATDEANAGLILATPPLATAAGFDPLCDGERVLQQQEMRSQPDKTSGVSL